MGRQCFNSGTLNLLNNLCGRYCQLNFSKLVGLWCLANWLAPTFGDSSKINSTKAKFSGVSSRIKCFNNSGKASPPTFTAADVKAEAGSRFPSTSQTSPITPASKLLGESSNKCPYFFLRYSGNGPLKLFPSNSLYISKQISRNSVTSS